MVTLEGWKLKGAEGFNQYYSNIYQERWKPLNEAMLNKREKWLRPCDLSVSDALQLPKKFLNESTRASLDETIEKNQQLLKRYYAMDLASAIVADQIEISDNTQQVLDMCAAPGGKSLILARKLSQNCQLTLNEMSASRRSRLKNVLREYLSENERKHITITGKDAIRFGVETPQNFDAILLDAPCSSEEHLLHDKQELKKWSYNRSRKLASIQYGLLCSALLALKPGGQLVYSTCSISPLENQELIEKLLLKKGDSFEIVSVNIPNQFTIEKLSFGQIFLPDQSELGPMYLCKLQKN